jgi:predicted DNA-binding ribbon-helix-helix protein
MASTKGQAVTFAPQSAEPTEEQARAALGQMTFFALPMALFRELSDAAAKRQMTLPQLLSTAVSDYLKKTEPDPAGKR